MKQGDEFTVYFEDKHNVLRIEKCSRGYRLESSRYNSHILESIGLERGELSEDKVGSFPFHETLDALEISIGIIAKRLDDLGIRHTFPVVAIKNIDLLMLL